VASFHYISHQLNLHCIGSFGVVYVVIDQTCHSDSATTNVISSLYERGGGGGVERRGEGREGEGRGRGREGRRGVDL